MVSSATEEADCQAQHLAHPHPLHVSAGVETVFQRCLAYRSTSPTHLGRCGNSVPALPCLQIHIPYTPRPVWKQCSSVALPTDPHSLHTSAGVETVFQRCLAYRSTSPTHLGRCGNSVPALPCLQIHIPYTPRPVWKQYSRVGFPTYRRVDKHSSVVHSSWPTSCNTHHFIFIVTYDLSDNGVISLPIIIISVMVLGRYDRGMRAINCSAAIWEAELLSKPSMISVRRSSDVIDMYFGRRTVAMASHVSLKMAQYVDGAMPNRFPALRYPTPVAGTHRATASRTSYIVGVVL